VTPRARQPHLTFVDPDGERRYRVRQVLVDDEDHNDWAIEGVVDLTEPRDGALIELVRIGR
jgi:hypothetical protein